MKKLAHIAVLALLCGCTMLNVDKTNPDGTRISFHGTSLFSNTTLKGLVVEGTTKTTSKLMGVTAGATEPNPESITATGTALGDLIGTAAKAVVKP